MAKELIFMGKREGKVRLALFDNSDGTARKLPVKEISEAVFVAGLKAGNLPVKGFSVNRGRIICKYGDWNKLPEADTEKGTMSLFGLVSFDIKDYLAVSSIPNKPKGCSADTVSLYYGIASVDWDTGMFRVLSPGMYYALEYYVSKLFYIYNGQITSSSVRAKNADTYGKTVDYTFSECDSTESYEEMATYFQTNANGAQVYLQWLFQRCEGFAYNNYNTASCIKDYMTKVNVYEPPALLLLGQRPITVLELPSLITSVAVLTNRKIDTIFLPKHSWIEINGVDDVVIECPKVTILNLSVGTHARLLRNSDDSPLQIKGWEGFSGSNGDYTGYNIIAMLSCFLEQPSDSVLKFDAESVSDSFVGISNVEVEFTNSLKSVHYSFNSFIGRLHVDGMLLVQDSFKRCELLSPLDLRNTATLVDSVNKCKGDILLPEFFTHVNGNVFKDTPVNYVKVIPDSDKYGFNRKVHYTLNIENPNLTVDVECGANGVFYRFSGGDIKELLYSAPKGSRCPKFYETDVYPQKPIRGVTYFEDDTFSKLTSSVLDFGLFPDVEVVPEGTVSGCKYTSIIFGPSIKKIEKKAVVSCDFIRWVYIPETVTEIEPFIYRPRIPYTICTKEGSVADMFAKKNGIAVKYVDDLGQFNQVVNEVPEELEGAVAVAVLSGKNDGEESAVLMACETTEMSPDIENVFAVQEKLQKSVYDSTKDSDWVSYVWCAKSDTYGDTVDFSPRLQLLMAFISNSATCNPSVLKITKEDLKYTTPFMFKSKNYTMLGNLVQNHSKNTIMVWVVLKDTLIINAFTETVSDIKSKCSVYSLLTQAEQDDKNYVKPTNLSANSMISHLQFIGGGGSVLNKRLSYTVYNKVFKACQNTYVSLGVYKGPTGNRHLITVDLVNLKYVVFKLAGGLVYDDGNLKTRGYSLLHNASKGMSGAELLDTIEGYTRLYSILSGDEMSGGDSMVRYLAEKDSILKCTEYDYTLPTTEVDALRLIYKVMSGNENNTVTVAELKASLRKSKLTKTISKGAWDVIDEHRSRSDTDETYHCKDGMFKVRSSYYTNVAWFIFGEKGEEGVFVSALAQNVEEKLQEIVGFYDTYSLVDGASTREEHYAHVNCMLPLDEFITVRKFDSGGCYTSYGDFKVALLISKISGKLTIAAVHGNQVVPLFWSNTFGNAFRILEICGMVAFSHKQEWLSKKHSTLCSGLFRERDAYEKGIPDFKGWSRNDTREYLRQGHCDSFICQYGIQEIFDLALKHPRTSDFVEKE